MGRIVRGAFVASLLLLGSPAWAGDADDERSYDEIVVTATHRETTLLDTPMGIGAVTDEMVEELGAQEMGEIFRMISGLNMGGEGAGQSRYTVRGVTSQQTNSVRDTAGAMVAVYLDGASLTSALGPARQITGNLFDIDRVEVLKGPQGTLFGEGAQGGAVRYIYKSPVINSWDAAVKFGTYEQDYSDDTSHDVNAMVNIPLIEDRLAARISVFDTDRAGYIDQLSDCTPQVGDGGYPTARPICTGSNQDVNSTSHDGGRAAMKYFGESWSIELAHYWVAQKGDGTAYTIAGNRGDSDLIADDPYVSNAREFTGLNGDGWDDVNVTRLSFDLTTGFADIKVVATDSVRDSLTFRELADPMVRGIDWATANGANSTGRCDLEVPNPDVNCPIPLDAQNMNSYGWDGWTDINRQTHEVRAVSNQPGKLRWTAGAYQKQSSDWSWSGVLYSMNPGREMYDDIFFFNSPETSHETLFKELSFFGEVSYDLTDEWEATFGARFASLEQTFLIGVKGEQIYQDSLNVGNWATPETFERYRSYEETELGGTDNDVVSPRLVLTWRPENMDLMAYVSYSEGYRPGGQNRGVLLDARRLDRDADVGQQTGMLTAMEIAELREEAEVLRSVVFFDGDTVNNIEVGTKFQMMDGRTEVQTALYLTDWQDVIQRSERPLPNGNIVGFNANEGAAEIWGLDVDVSTQLTPNLRGSVVAALVDTELTEALQNQGKELIFSSPYSVTLNLDYNWAVGNDMNATLHFDVSNFDERWFNTNNTIALPAYTLANARLTLNDVDNQWAVVLWSKNLTDERVVRDRYSDLTTGDENPWLGDLRGSYQYLDPPRSVGVDFRWNFN
ncbi:MAG: TonB-dependent receptor [Pseudomonadota bacterium]